MSHRPLSSSVICVVAMFGGWATVCAEDVKDGVVDGDLNALAEFLGRDLGGDELETIQPFVKDEREPIQLLLAAIRYRHDPEHHRDQLFSRFAVHDYKARKRGTYNMITADDFTTAVGQIEEKHPKSKPAVVMILAFTHYRDKNNWFMSNGQRVSAARFLRGAFLATAFSGSKIDAVEIANQIDKKTREVDLEEDGMAE